MTKSNENGKQKDGYMRALHRVEEKFYGPKSPLPLTAKVILFIRHNTIRWEREEGEFSYSTIMQATGGSERGVILAIKKLQKEKFIVVKKRNDNGKDLTNIIGLNPSYFGDFIEREKQPRFSVITGGAGLHKSTEGVGNKVQREVCTKVQSKSSENALPEREARPLNNSLNNYLKEQDENLDFFDPDRTLPPKDLREKFPQWFRSIPK